MNNPIILEIRDIKWKQSKSDKKDLPKKLKLKWNSNDWNEIQVSSFLSAHFNVKVNSLNIKVLDVQDSSG